MSWLNCWLRTQMTLLEKTRVPANVVKAYLAKKEQPKVRISGKKSGNKWIVVMKPGTFRRSNEANEKTDSATGSTSAVSVSSLADKNDRCHGLLDEVSSKTGA
ncbi:hypothetical protein EB796_015533 [Bugula neritina]|uniref:Uncharacterized protein n=1 Tax=Bugula neritina TaxID=10212 RepID=A0A7J7JL59_BUGNE|nr:hypothetical protein EB796_015533 [Bugula neritina]